MRAITSFKCFMAPGKTKVRAWGRWTGTHPTSPTPISSTVPGDVLIPAARTGAMKNVADDANREPQTRQLLIGFQHMPNAN